MAHNLLRAAGIRAGVRYAKARTATIRSHLIALRARVSRRGRGNLVLRLPESRHREQSWLNLWTEACGPPARAACQPRSGPHSHAARHACPPAPRSGDQDKPHKG
jgi:hypothetical protein